MIFEIKNERSFIDFCNLFQYTGKEKKSELFLEIIRLLRQTNINPIIEIKFIISIDSIERKSARMFPCNLIYNSGIVAEQLNQILEKNINEIIY